MQQNTASLLHFIYIYIYAFIRLKVMSYGPSNIYSMRHGESADDFFSLLKYIKIVLIGNRLYFASKHMPRERIQNTVPCLMILLLGQ